MIVPPFGIRLCTRYDYAAVFENRLAGYVTPDILWTGIKTIAAMAGANYVRISPHDAPGPVSIIVTYRRGN